MPGLPTGTLTFLFTDVEGSIRLWEAGADSMRAAARRHDELIETIATAHGGIIHRPRGEGDSRFGVFQSAAEAVAAAFAMQQALQTEQWPTSQPVRVRMALHTGEADLRDGDYYGPAVNRCARLRAVAVGGQVLVSGRTAELARGELPPGLSLRSLGLHQLKDLVEPEHVYQLVHPELTDGFPPLSSSPGNLPARLTSFVNRVREIAELDALLLSARLVTLTGTGGSGKSRLALEAASRVSFAFPDGAWLVELAAMADASAAPSAIATAIGIRVEIGRPVLTTLLETLRSRRLLLVLDNCEHLLEGIAHTIEVLLEGCPSVRVLCTSREPLHVPGERELPVPPLAAPDPRSLPDLDDVRGIDAVKLFADRAVAVRPSFRVERSNMALLAQICHRLDGLPLAVELAAARTKHLNLSYIAEHLDRRFELLSGGPRTAPPRLRTLRATLDWSHDLLDDAERALLRRLAVFAGSWSLEAAEAVTVGPHLRREQVVDVLGELIDKSLVIGDIASEDGRDDESAAPDESLTQLGLRVSVDERALQAARERLGDVGVMRYRSLETVRQYALERLIESGESERVRSAHAEYMVRFAEHAEQELRGPFQHVWLKRLDHELDNIRVALTWFRDRWEVANRLRLASALGRFWLMRRHIGEARRWLELPSERPAEVSERLWARALNELGTLARAEGDFELATSLCLDALAAYRRLEDPGGAATSLNMLAIVAAQHGDYETSDRLFTESLALFRAAQDTSDVARVLHNLADNAHEQGRPALAEAHLTECLGLLTRTGDTWPLAHTLLSLGELALNANAPGTAETYLSDSRRLWLRLGDKWGVGTTSTGLARLWWARGNRARAAALYREGLGLLRDARAWTHVPPTLEHLAELACAGDDGEAAAVLLGAAAALREARRHPIPPAQVAAHQRVLELARRSLPADAFAAAWSMGAEAAMQRIDEIIERALDVTGSYAGVVRAPSRSSEPAIMPG